LEPIVVGLLGITHPHASARVRALREIDGVEVVAAADDDSRLNYFTDKYDMEARSVEAVLQDERINAIMVHSKSKDMVAHALRALEAGKSVVVEKPGGGTVEDLERLAEAEAQAGPGQVVQVGYNVRLAQSITRTPSCTCSVPPSPSTPGCTSPPASRMRPAGRTPRRCC